EVLSAIVRLYLLRGHRRGRRVGRGAAGRASCRGRRGNPMRGRQDLPHSAREEGVRAAQPGTRPEGVAEPVRAPRPLEGRRGPLARHGTARLLLPFHRGLRYSLL
ncbi:MAG: hypothetical protein AVDCRST_MAG93-5018, partial [uncultured Chloroflexia bacterium]